LGSCSKGRSWVVLPTHSHSFSLSVPEWPDYYPVQTPDLQDCVSRNKRSCSTQTSPCFCLDLSSSKAISSANTLSSNLSDCSRNTLQNLPSTFNVMIRQAWERIRRPLDIARERAPGCQLSAAPLEGFRAHSSQVGATGMSAASIDKADGFF